MYKHFPHDYPDKKPDSLEKALDILKKVLTSEQLKDLKEVPVERLISYHMDLGMWIRNNFGLWEPGSKLFKSLGVSHPDSASQKIIVSLWGNLNGKQQ